VQFAKSETYHFNNNNNNYFINRIKIINKLLTEIEQLSTSIYVTFLVFIKENIVFDKLSIGF
jgi:hypothetical protein